MKIAVLSDIHSNYSALEKVLTNAQEKGVEHFWILGDLFGYGPNPCECLEWLLHEKERADWVLGNHDAMLIGMSILSKNGHSKDFLSWLLGRKYQERIRKLNNFSFKELYEVGYDPKSGKVPDPVKALQLNLADLERKPKMYTAWRKMFTGAHIGPLKISKDGINYWLVHASRLPGEQLGPYIYPWSPEHLSDEIRSLMNEKAKKTAPIVQWYGHSHVANLITLKESDMGENLRDRDDTCFDVERTYTLGKNITLANPGSVGQPRNGDTRACYAILDTLNKEVTFHRVNYAIRQTTREMTLKGYPDRLVERLQKAYLPSDQPPNDSWRDCLENQKNTEIIDYEQ
jgi:predicted phosphodiesterase